MAYSQISETRLQRIYEGARCSTLETRFIIERLRISERAFLMLAEQPDVAHSAKQFAAHLLRGQGLVRSDNSAADQASSSLSGLRTAVRDLVSTAWTRARTLRLRSAA